MEWQTSEVKLLGYPLQALPNLPWRSMEKFCGAKPAAPKISQTENLNIWY